MIYWRRVFTVLLIALPTLSGCTGFLYYWQSAEGHLEIMAARQDVDQLVDDPSQPDALRSQMSLAQEVRQFAVDQLALPDNQSYQSYVDVGRDYVTIAIFAAQEFSLSPQVWCFPVFGCVPYRAHFTLKTAREQKEALEASGFDVYVTGVTAYSTLGWTSDPLLNTMFRDDVSHLAGVVFHELAHQKIYIRNDTAFNEAFAVAVERTGVRKWLRSTGDSEGLRRYDASEKRMADFLRLIDEARFDLFEIYQSDVDVAQKRKDKELAIQRLRAKYTQMRDKRWGGYTGYDNWFGGPINNAKLVATAVYSDLVPAFIRLFETCGENYPRFYKAVEQLGKVDKSQRVVVLTNMDSCA